MARSLAELQKQYHSSSKPGRPGGGGPRGRGPGMGGPGGKPKNTKKTIGRLLGYVGKYKALFFVVLIFMMINTVTSLVGGYLTRPIINRLSMFVGLEFDQSTLSTPIYIALDTMIETVKGWSSGLLTSVVGDSFSGAAADVMFYVGATILILVCIYAFGIITNYMQSRVMMTISQNSLEKIRNDLFKKLQTLPVRYFDTHPTGEVMSRFTNDVDNIDVMLNNSLTGIVSGVISLVGTLVFMITTNIWLTIITVVFIPFFALGGMKIAKMSRKYYSGQQAALGAANGYVEETVTGQKVVKVFNHEKVCCEEFETLNEDLRDKQMKAQFYGGIMGPIMHNTSMISYAVTVGVGGVLLVFGKLDPGALQLFAQYSKQFSMPINNISQQTASIFSALAGAERVFAVMDEAPETPDAPDAIDMPEMRGDDLCISIKSNIDTSHIAVVLVSALSDQQSIINGLSVKADAYVTKPFDTKILQLTINNLVESRLQLRQQLSTFDTIDDSLPDSTSELDLKLMTEMKEIIERNLDNNDFTVDTLAYELRVSRTSLYNKIKGLTGNTPSDLIRIYRINKAKTLLRDHRHTVTEVAELVGFTDQKYFREVFKKTVGTTPSEYAKSEK